MYIKRLTILALVFISQLGLCQVVFENQTSIYNPNYELYSGSCGAFADANGDGLDDLVVIDKGDHMFVGYNMGVGIPMEWHAGPKVSSSREYLCLLSDINNDGTKEVITSGAFSRTKIYKRQENGNYNFSQQIKRSILAQGGNTIDLNGDHLLDLFVCSDEDDNMIAFNSNGMFNVDENFIDWTTEPISDNSGNYASEWADYNGDGLLDLSIAKCRLGVTDPKDPQRINRLFIQQLDGTYVDEAKSRNVNIGWQSWTTSTIDYDNDGDFDLFVSNHDFNHQLLENDGNGFFTEVNFSKSPINNFSYQSIVRDFDNNGFQDILIVGQGSNLLLIGSDSGQFDMILNPLGQSANSAIVGDINHDGRIDVMSMYSVGINIPGTIPDDIFVNTTENQNAYIDIQLIGTTSNRDAVGALLKLYTNLGVQSQVVQSGESYGITNSYTRHFGLGLNPTIDSLVIQWPSGIKEVIYPETINTTYVLKEGFCYKENITLIDTVSYLCGDSVTLIGPVSQSDYSWSTGDTTSSISISKPGIYILSYIDDEGCNVTSNPISVQKGSIEGDLFPDNINTVSCLNDAIKLTSPHSSRVIDWSTGQTDRTININKSSLIYLNVVDQCGMSHVDSIDVTIVDPTISEFVGDTVAFGENAKLFAKGEGMSWFISATSTSQIHNGNTLNLFNVEESRPYYAEQELVEYTHTENGGISHEEATLIFDNSMNYRMHLTLTSKVLLKSAQVYALVPGDRKILLEKDGQNVYSKTYNLSKGWNTIEFNHELSAFDEYVLITDEQLNNSNFGTEGPHLAHELSGDFPYFIGNELILIGEETGADVYPYFYNIQIETQPINCKSERQAIWVYLDTDVATSDLIENSIEVYPNPVLNEFSIKSLSPLDGVKFKLYDINGRIIQWGSCTGKWTTINIQDCNPGMYFISLEIEEKTLSKKIIKL